MVESGVNMCVSFHRDTDPIHEDSTLMMQLLPTSLTRSSSAPLGAGIVASVWRECMHSIYSNDPSNVIHIVGLS